MPARRVEEWDPVMRLLHWGMAALVLFQLGYGVWMKRLVEDPYERFLLYQTHKSWGFVIFVLALVRLGWRLARGAPPPPAGARPLEVAAARAVHALLYTLMIAQPVVGWLMASASPLQDKWGLPTMVFGLFALPDPFRPGSAALEGALKLLHSGCAGLLAVLVAGHAGAALWHHFVRGDRVLLRMIVGR